MLGDRNCRICGETTRTLLDLGAMPLANHLMDAREERPEEFPLLVESCSCGNFQLRYCVEPEKLYTSYSYATPRSPSLERHYKQLIAYLEASGYLRLGSRALEIGSNVGEFLSFLRPHVRSVVGVDPARNIAELANAAGIPTIPEFFGTEFARDYRRSSGEVELIVARHCMAHNPDPYEILNGVAELLTPDGVLVMENAYALKTFEHNEFDQIYHEHMFYYTLQAVKVMFAKCGLTLCDVMMSDIHGGTISCIARRSEYLADRKSEDLPVAPYLEREKTALDGGVAERFAEAALRAQADLRSLIADLRAEGKTVYAYGATAKGATLLNFSGLTHGEIPYCADSTPIKQGKFVPKCGVEIVSEEWALKNPPDTFLLTAWNYRDELIAKVRSAGLDDVRFIMPVPNVALV